MFDNFRFPKAPLVPLYGVIVELRLEEGYDAPKEDWERVLMGGERAWPWDFGPVAVLLPQVDIPWCYTEEGDESVAFITECGHVGIIPVRVAKNAYKSVYQPVRSFHDHLDSMTKAKKIMSMMERAGWEFVSSEEIIDSFREGSDEDFTNFRRHHRLNYTHGDYDPIPKAILSAMPNNDFWFCFSCGHPHDLMFYHEKVCERCDDPLEPISREDVEGMSSTIIILSDDEEEGSFPGLDKEDWA